MITLYAHGESYVSLDKTMVIKPIENDPRFGLYINEVLKDWDVTEEILAGRNDLILENV